MRSLQMCLYIRSDPGRLELVFSLAGTFRRTMRWFDDTAACLPNPSSLAMVAST